MSALAISPMTSGFRYPSLPKGEDMQSDNGWKILKTVGEVAMAAGSIIAAVVKIVQSREAPTSK